MKAMISFFIVSLFSSFIYAQNLRYESAFIGYRFYQENKRIKVKEVAQVLQHNSASEKLMRQRNKLMITEGIASVLSGLCGVEIGSRILQNKHISKELIFITMGSSVGSFLLHRATLNKQQESFQIYNQANAKTGSKVQFYTTLGP